MLYAKARLLLTFMSLAILLFFQTGILKKGVLGFM